MKNLAALSLSVLIMISGALIGCQQSRGDETIYDFLDMTYGDIQAKGNIGPLSHYEGGGSPVYEMTGYEGAYLVFPAVTDNTSAETANAETTDKFPVKILIQGDNMEIIPGLNVGMDAENASTVVSEWNDIYMSSENSLYYTTYVNESICITAAWAIPEELFSEWAESISNDADYYAEFLKFIEPFREKPVGKIVELSIEKSNN